MNPPEANDPLDALLREENQYIDDRDFTARVLARLPRRRLGLRPALLLAVTVIGAVVAAFCLPWKELILPDPNSLFSTDSPTLSAWTLVLAVMGSLAWAAVSALQWED
jgi:hypothetical protein